MAPAPGPCTTCRSDVNTGDKFCITCGASYNELQCPSCNAQLTVGFSCTQCGETLDWDRFFGIQQNAERPSPADQASGRPGSAPRLDLVVKRNYVYIVLYNSDIACFHRHRGGYGRFWMGIHSIRGHRHHYRLHHSWDQELLHKSLRITAPCSKNFTRGALVSP